MALNTEKLERQKTTRGKGFGTEHRQPENRDRTSNPGKSQGGGYQAIQDQQAAAVAVSAGAVANRGMQQLQALEDQQLAYAEQFSEAASDLIVSTEALAWRMTAEKTAQKLGAYSPVDAVNVFNAFSLDLGSINSRLQGIAQPAALCAGKATAGF
jgi:hypothetical protein